MDDFGIKENYSVKHSISYINPKLDYVLQRYIQIGVNTSLNAPVIESSFSIFKKELEEPISIKDYPYEVKRKVSDIVFTLKKTYFETYQPEVVEHFIKQEHDFEKVKSIFERKLNLSNYNIESLNNLIVYIRKDLI